MSPGGRWEARSVAMGEVAVVVIEAALQAAVVIRRSGDQAQW